jgi:hypothetical protein
VKQHLRSEWAGTELRDGHDAETVERGSAHLASSRASAARSAALVVGLEARRAASR